MTEREILMDKIATIDFAIVDLHLFLDTHPNNMEILKKLNDYEKKSEELHNEYEEKFDPISSSNTNGNSWQWISAPWPWDKVESEDN